MSGRMATTAGALGMKPLDRCRPRRCGGFATRRPPNRAPSPVLSHLSCAGAEGGARCVRRPLFCRGGMGRCGHGSAGDPFRACRGCSSRLGGTAVERFPHGCREAARRRNGNCRLRRGNCLVRHSGPIRCAHGVEFGATILGALFAPLGVYLAFFIWGCSGTRDGDWATA